MYERMLDKQTVPDRSDMTAYCGEAAELFTLLNDWLTDTFYTEQKIVFPYGNHYGWRISHKKKGKLMCNVFAENNAFTVMMRLSNEQFEAVYQQVGQETQEYIDNRYPCGGGGWIHYRVTGKTQFDDICKLLELRCA